MQKSLIIFVTFILMASIVAADVHLPINYIDENGQTSPGFTEYEVYYHYTNGQTTFWKGDAGYANTGADIYLHPTLPAGVDNYLIFFFRDEFLPWVARTNYECTGGTTCQVPTYNVVFRKATDALAPIRGFSATSVNVGEPLVIDVEAELAGDIHSPFRLNTQFTDYIPTGHEDDYSANTEIRVYANGQLIGTQQRNLFAGSTERFTFEWTPTIEGIYEIKVESEVIDQQVEFSPGFDNIQEYITTVEVFDELDEICAIQLPDGVYTSPVEPVAGQQTRIYGTRRSNQWDNSQATPIEANLELNIYSWNTGTQEYDIFVYGETIQPGPAANAITPEGFQYLWTPATAGNYLVQVRASTNCATPYQNSEEVHAVEVEVLSPSSGNVPPVLRPMPDQRIEVGSQNQQLLDLTQYASDYENDPLSYTANSINSNIATCNAQAGMLTCTGVSVGQTEVWVRVTDGTSVATGRLNLRVAQTGNTAPTIDMPDQIILTPNVITVLDLDDYSNDAEGDQLSYTVSGNTNIAITIVGSQATILSNEGWTGAEDVTFTVFDGLANGMDTTTLLVQGTVGDNNPPVIHSEPDELTIKFEEYTYQVNATDADGDVLKYELTDSPKDMKIDENTGLVTWTPERTGEFDVWIKVTDGRGGRAIQQYELEVERPKKDVEREEDTLIARTRVVSESYYKPGDTIHIQAGFENTNGYDFERLYITASMPQLGGRDRVGPFELDDGDEIMKSLYLKVPTWAKEGTYTIRVTYNNDDFRRVIHRNIKVTN